MRTIRKIYNASKVNMGGIILDQPLPADGINQIDPFILVHHWYQIYKGGNKQEELGVGPHPHRGFSPVTFIFKGGVHHQDSEGNSSIVMEGGTQWMNSGKGIVHSERPIKEIAEKGGEFEIIQFWVVAPAKNKLDNPSYQSLIMDETPKVISPDKKVTTWIVSGNFKGVTGKIKTYTPLLSLRLDIKKGGKIDIPIPAEFNAFVYQLDGLTNINSNSKASGKQLIWFNNDGKHICIEGLENTRAIVLAGLPIGEKVVSYGPIVMNTQEEIMKAINDYHDGKMGKLIETFK